MTEQSLPAPVAADAPAPTLVLVSTHGSLRNWAEKRLYEPLVGTHHLEAIFWDRTGIVGPQGRDEARRYGIGTHEYRGGAWGLGGLLRYFGFIVRELDAIQAATGLDVVVGCDVDVLPAIVWHRLTRGLRYRIFREEVDWYAGCRSLGTSVAARVKRFVFDGVEALLHSQCDAIFTLNDYAVRRLRAWGVPPRKITVTGLWKADEFHAADHEAWKRRLRDDGVLTPAQYEAVKGRIVVSFLGFFYAGTHLRALLETVAKFPGEFALVTAGRGHDLPVVEEFARTHANILYLGWIDEDVLKALYKITDIVYQPLNPDDNVNWKYFGSGNKTFETLAAGCMFIGSAINERVDLNREAEYAMMVDFTRDVRDQVEAMFRAILADRTELTRRQANARKLYESRYNYANHARIWRALVDGRRPPAP